MGPLARALIAGWIRIFNKQKTILTLKNENTFKIYHFIFFTTMN